MTCDEKAWNEDWVKIPPFKKHHTYKEKKGKQAKQLVNASHQVDNVKLFTGLDTNLTLN